MIEQKTAIKSPSMLWAVPLLVAAGLLIFIMSSYPMMRPGFDVWWHLGIINHVSDNPTPIPFVPQFFWHYLWNSILRTFAIKDLFNQALIIHRVQFSLTALLITCAAYFAILSINERFHFNRLEMWTCSIAACVIWFVMHGTHSVAHDQGAGSSLTQSWILWYSVNYQISLPFIICATSLTLYYFASDVGAVTRALLQVSILVCLLVAFAFHMAEIAYYVVCLLLLGLLFANGTSRLLTLFGIFVISIICILIVLRFVHVTPTFFSLFDGRSIAEMLQSISEQGESLRSGNYLRLDTGWTILHLLSLLSLLGVLVFSYISQPRMHSWRTRSSILFLLATSIFPLALFTNIGAGIFALLAYGLIAYRFAYFDLIFIGIPIVTLHVLQLTQQKLSPNAHVGGRELGVWISFFIVIGGIISASAAFDRTVNLFTYSLSRSLSPNEMYFGLSNDQRRTLGEMAQRLRKAQPDSPVCTDIFTAYYLFFIYDYKQVYLPGALAGVPGSASDQSTCNYQLNQEK